MYIKLARKTQHFHTQLNLIGLIPRSLPIRSCHPSSILAATSLAPASSVGKGPRRRRAKPRDALLHVQRRVVHRPRPGCRPPPSLPIYPHATAPNSGAVSRMSQPPPALRLERPSSGRRRCPPSAAPPTPRPPRAAPRLGCRPLTSVRSASPTLLPLTAAWHPGCHTPWPPSPQLHRGGRAPHRRERPGPGRQRCSSLAASHTATLDGGVASPLPPRVLRRKRPLPTTRNAPPSACARARSS